MPTSPGSTTSTLAINGLLIDGDLAQEQIAWPKKPPSWKDYVEEVMRRLRACEYQTLLDPDPRTGDDILVFRVGQDYRSRALAIHRTDYEGGRLGVLYVLNEGGSRFPEGIVELLSLTARAATLLYLTASEEGAYLSVEMGLELSLPTYRNRYLASTTS